LKILVILASTRPGRKGERIAKWVTAAVAQHPQFDAQMVDLAEYDLPHFNEPVSPRFNADRRPAPRVKRWLDVAAAADGYIIVTAEYNHSIPGPLKDALDFLDFQFAKKPVAIVSYGVVGGARAAEHLKGILAEVKAAIVPEALAVTGRPETQFDEAGTYLGDATSSAGLPATLANVLNELAWWTRTLKAGRGAGPGAGPDAHRPAATAQAVAKTA
jgi:NAD(P)H-dependent FMN reductase